MKIGELLRQLADYADSQDETVSTQEVGDPEMSGQAGTGDSPDQVYVGPLQQKHELLKKATGVDNNVDQFADDDELEQMKQNAGVAQQPTIINQTFEINPGAAQPVTPLNPAIISPLADLQDSD